MTTDHSSLTAMQKETTLKEETMTIEPMVKATAQVKHANGPTETEMKEKMMAIRADQETDKIEARDTPTVAKRRGFLEWTIIKTSIMLKRMLLPISNNQLAL